MLRDNARDVAPIYPRALGARPFIVRQNVASREGGSRLCACLGCRHLVKICVERWILEIEIEKGQGGRSPVRHWQEEALI